MNTTVTLGKTGITVNKNGFGALPIQRISMEESGKLLKKAYDAGIRFFDTARFYTDSEAKIGKALSSVRSSIYIATKTGAQNAEEFRKDLHTSLTLLKTDYIDIYAEAKKATMEIGFVRNQETVPDCTKPWKKPEIRGKSATSVSATTV